MAHANNILAQTNYGFADAHDNAQNAPRPLWDLSQDSVSAQVATDTQTGLARPPSYNSAKSEDESNYHEMLFECREISASLRVPRRIGSVFRHTIQRAIYSGRSPPKSALCIGRTKTLAKG
jgi:hypothetical protein